MLSTNEITYQGMNYVAQTSDGECDGCDLRKFGDCYRGERECTASRRDDGRHIIWVKKEQKEVKEEKKYFKIVDFRGDKYGSVANEDCVGCAFESESITCSSLERVDQLPCTTYMNDDVSIIWKKIPVKTVARPEQTTEMKHATTIHTFNFPNGFETADKTVAQFVDENYDQLCDDYDDMPTLGQSFEDFVTLIMKWAVK